MEDAGRLCKRDYAVNDGLPVEVRNSEQHLRLVINECDCAVVGSQQSFFAALCATVILRHGYPFLSFHCQSHIFRSRMMRRPLLYRGDECFELASSDARNATALAISSGTLSRPSEFRRG